MAVVTFRDLIAWQRAMDLAVEVYRLAQPFPREEAFGLTSQMRRAATSVPFNIAEGQARLHRGDFVRQLSIARGSLAELDTQIELAIRLGYTTAAACTAVLALVDETGRLLNGLIRSLERPASRPKAPLQSSHQPPATRN